VSEKSEIVEEETVEQDEISVREYLNNLGDDAQQKKFILFSLFISERLSQSLMRKIICVMEVFGVELPRLNHQKFLTALYQELAKEKV